MGTLRIDVLGSLFCIDAKEDTQYLELLLENYKKMVHIIENSSGTVITDPLQISILAGITLCDELYKEKAKSTRIMKQQSITTDDLAEAERITLALIEKIDKALDDNLG